MPFEGFDFTNFWDDNEYALREYVCGPPSDEMIAELEAEFGYKLPESYIWLMKRHNGGIPVNTCCPTDEPTSWAEDHAAIGVAICDCPSARHDMIFWITGNADLRANPGWSTSTKSVITRLSIWLIILRHLSASWCMRMPLRRTGLG